MLQNLKNKNNKIFSKINMNFDISKRLKGKAKIEKEKETVKPTVINDKLIRYFHDMLIMLEM